MKYPVGIQTFGKIIEGNYLYVDKTELIYRLTHDYSYVFLSRPRRFGKSLMLSTLQAYFEGRKDLFKGLAIEKLEKTWKCHPVLRFDLSGTSYLNSNAIREKINEYMSMYENAYGVDRKNETMNLGVRFFSLIRNISEKTESKVVVLIDEYDKPMLDTLNKDNLHENIKSELRGFYGVLKESDEYIRFAMLTGVTKFGKINIFSGLNNLRDITLSPKFNTLCGISESEFRTYFPASIKEFAYVRNVKEEEAYHLFKSNYDGYRFAPYGENIYNPISVLTAFDDNRIGDYWYETGSSTYLIHTLSSNHFDLKQLDHPVRNSAQLSDISSLDHDLVPLLYQAGYLTIKDYEEEDDAYTLGMPNMEVRRSFWNSLIKHFFRPHTTEKLFAIENFRESLLTGDVEAFLVRLRSLMADTNSEHEPDKEIHFQNMFAIFVKLLGYVAHAEAHTSRGRCDLTVETPDFIFIFEFKTDGNPEEALRQIVEMGYAERFEADRRTLILAGVNFSTHKRTIDKWEIKRER